MRLICSSAGAGLKTAQASPENGSSLPLQKILGPDGLKKGHTQTMYASILSFIMSFSLTLCVGFKKGLFVCHNLTSNGFLIKLFGDHGIQITAKAKCFLIWVSGSDPRQGGVPHLRLRLSVCSPKASFSVGLYNHLLRLNQHVLNVVYNF